MTENFQEPKAGDSAQEPQAPPTPPPPPSPYGNPAKTEAVFQEAFEEVLQEASQDTPRQGSRQASEPAHQQGSRQASRPTSRPASRQAAEPTNQAAPPQGFQQPFQAPPQQPSQGAPSYYPPPSSPYGYQQGAAPGYQQSPPPGYSQGFPQGGYAQQGYPPGYSPTPYPGQPGYAAAPQQQKKRVWPWVLGGCLILALLGLGGCVGCIAYLASVSEKTYDNNYDYYPYGDDDDWSYDYDFDDEFGYPFYDGEVFTLDELKELAPDVQSKIENGRCTTGVYEVGAGKDIEAGLYYLEGSQATEGEFHLFKKEASGSGYNLHVSIIYFGNYFADLQEGDLIIFLAPESAHMYKAPDKPLESQVPYLSGCYRVGIDIPAGTYKVTYQENAPKDASGEAGAYIMNDMAWKEDSMLEEYFLMIGGSHTITIKEGQFLELYTAQMTPVG